MRCEGNCLGPADPTADVKSLDRDAARSMRKLAEGKDPEMAHFAADLMLLDLLEMVGFTETVEAFKEVPKWYA